MPRSVNEVIKKKHHKKNPFIIRGLRAFTCRNDRFSEIQLCGYFAVEGATSAGTSTAAVEIPLFIMCGVTKIIRSFFS